MRVKFRMLVFQNGYPDEELETGVHEFADGLELARVLVRFAAMQSGVRLLPHVMEIYTTRRTDELEIGLPVARQGYGPETFVVITSVIPV